MTRQNEPNLKSGAPKSRLCISAEVEVYRCCGAAGQAACRTGRQKGVSGTRVFWEGFSAGSLRKGGISECWCWRWCCWCCATSVGDSKCISALGRNPDYTTEWLSEPNNNPSWNGPALIYQYSLKPLGASFVNHQDGTPELLLQTEKLTRRAQQAPGRGKTVLVHWLSAET